MSELNQQCIIVDLDGTLFRIDHRVHHVTGGNKNWAAFFEGIPHDTLNEPVSELLHAMASIGYYIVLASGRPESTRQATELVLSEDSVEYDALYMRADGDYRPDHVVKKELLNQIYEDGFNPLFVVDDRQSVVEMWRDNGLFVFQVVPEQPVVSLKSKLIVMVGPSGAGKTTMIETNLAANFNAAVVSSDHLRQVFTGDPLNQSMNDAVFKAAHDLTKTYLRHGMTVVFDATNIKTKDRIAVANLSQGVCPVEYWVINRPMDEKKATAGWRAKVPGLLERHENTFNSNLKDILRGDGLSNVTVIDMRNK